VALPGRRLQRASPAARLTRSSGRQRKRFIVAMYWPAREVLAAACPTMVYGMTRTPAKGRPRPTRAAMARARWVTKAVVRSSAACSSSSASRTRPSPHRLEAAGSVGAHTSVVTAAPAVRGGEPWGGMGWGARRAEGQARAACACHAEAVGAGALVVGQLGGAAVGQRSVGRATGELCPHEGGQVDPGGEPREEEEEEAREDAAHAPRHRWHEAQRREQRPERVAAEALGPGVGVRRRLDVANLVDRLQQGAWQGECRVRSRQGVQERSRELVQGLQEGAQAA